MFARRGRKGKGKTAAEGVGFGYVGRAPGRIVGGWAAVPAEEVDAVVGRMLICGVWWAAGPYQMRPEK